MTHKSAPQLTADQLRMLLEVVDDWLLLMPDPPRSAHPASVKEIRRVLAEQLKEEHNG
ncbi:MAG: hypothetical protein ACE5HB_05270 [Terriglobia bacterium]